MSSGYETISFLSDYGTADEFVGVVHSVLRTIAPDVAVVDVTHEIPPFDVRAGSLTLARAAQFLAPGVVLAVVDPGVGTERRAVAVEVGGGQSVLVGPDNGLLAPAVALVGGATAAVELDAREYQLEALGSTFGGRDVFAPVAAHLCNGVPLDRVGTPIDPAGLLPGVMPIAQAGGEGIDAEVLWVDRYGNAQLNVDPDEITDLGDAVLLTAGETTRRAKRCATFAHVPVGGVGLIVDSYGLLAVVADRSSASAELGLTAGAAIRLESADGTEPHRAVSPVELGPRGG